jgi:hypothetical protein
MAQNTAGQTLTTSYPDRVAQRAMGTVAFNATAITATDYVEVTCGFTPRKVVWCNDTSRIEITWREGMAANTCIKAAANGARTLETSNGGITVIEGGFRVTQNATLAAILASQTCRWEAVK